MNEKQPEGRTDAAITGGGLAGAPPQASNCRSLRQLHRFFRRFLIADLTNQRVPPGLMTPSPLALQINYLPPFTPHPLALPSLPSLLSLYKYLLFRQQILLFFLQSMKHTNLLWVVIFFLSPASPSFQSLLL